jgi:hypothetical protein
MTDDIVTRLQDGIKACFCHDSLDDYECDICPLHEDASDEIERLRELVGFQDGQLRQIRNAIYDEGVNPQHHRSVMRRHRKEWPTLWEAIDESMKDLAQKPRRNRDR